MGSCGNLTAFIMNDKECAPKASVNCNVNYAGVCKHEVELNSSIELREAIEKEYEQLKAIDKHTIDKQDELILKLQREVRRKDEDLKFKNKLLEEYIVSVDSLQKKLVDLRSKRGLFVMAGFTICFLIAKLFDWAWLGL